MALFSSPPPAAQLGWRWPHFTATELSCSCRKHCKGEYFHDPRFLDALEAMRRDVDPLIIRSGHRCRAHNTAVGGVQNSYHAKAIAADIAVTNKDRARILQAAVNAGFTGLGYGRSFFHVDLGPARAWTYPGALGLWVRALGFDPMRNPLKPQKQQA
ncbi:MAG: D-Ala-D-Ala carboxypeptidase family metallohydrolase [Aquidulcibacter sp.]|jgi:zinc D-Ala-D-Ala carboxypeptidase|uniref:D-Ala-D-Ala carboxypeptidase family metallohydrolase n=1 Tax=Aquidulcibacter sp. TaxID=2052990 RepID=UPI0022BAAFC7|nr:D-Ala-D-Ala carboxypeptidase family metallohydrolase [Aquidulcibacter sp.]MCE2890722.1 D-Ala-D-Ala carboxypeptidase family metallohydrolase [Hyphomonadaceae bacterium]MCZ8208185.1 D-Ala-D-Ala carboxypeptidase family metallohydrolase [Aquidulcibacter sp.]